MAIEDPILNPQETHTMKGHCRILTYTIITPRRNLVVKGPRDLDEYRGRMLGNIIPEDSLSLLGIEYTPTP